MDPDNPIRFLSPPVRPDAPGPGADALDPVAVGVLAVIAIGFVVYAALSLRAARRPVAQIPVRRPCRWYRYKRRRGAAMARFTCASCGVEAYSQDGLAPKECKRALRPAAL
jgi:hypothetical protein